MIKVENIAKAYGKHKILNNVSFEAAPGEFLALIGRNGSGKSTLMQILSGISTPDAGTLSYFNQNPLADRKVFRQLCGYVPQANPLMEELSVSDNLKLFGADASIVSDPLFASFELETMLKKPVAKLSGGMKRRVAIACSVHHMPSILFMDEPTTALDIYFKASIHQWMEEYRKRGGILIMATHDQSEIDMCDHKILLSDGVTSPYDGLKYKV